MRYLPRAAALAAILVTPALTSAPVQPPTYTYRGTVHTVQPRAGSLELITGVGFALRLVPMGAVAATRIEKGGGAVAPLGEPQRESDAGGEVRSEEHTSELQSHSKLVWRLLL